jgi:hypothetical protein
VTQYGGGSPLLFSYERPVVTSLTPNHANSTGDVMVHVEGTNFGPAPCLTIVRHEAGLPAAMSGNGTMTACASEGELYNVTHTSLAYMMPAGHGIMYVSVSASPAWTAGTTSEPDAQSTFVYDAPTFYPSRDPLGDEFAIIDGEKVFPDATATTEGGNVVTVRGHSFGHRRHYYGDRGTDVRVIFGSNTTCSLYEDEPDAAQQRCMITEHTHDRLSFTVPPGIGAGVEVNVTVGGQMMYPPMIFSYARPRVTGVSPDPTGMTRDGAEIVIRGDNFGTYDQHVERGALDMVSVTVVDNDMNHTCGYTDEEGDVSVQWTRGRIQCALPSVRVGVKSMLVTVAQQAAPKVTPNDELFTSVCAPGFYGVTHEHCRECPPGGVCEGGVGDPISDIGWYALTFNDTVEPDRECARRGLVTDVRESCTSIVPCEPKYACTGNNTCLYGYKSKAPEYRCSSCEDCRDANGEYIDGCNPYYKRAGECVECPKNVLFLMIGVLVAGMFCIGGAYYLQKKKMSLTFINIGVDYFQVLAIFATSRVQWPPIMKELFHILSAFNFNIEIVAPECTIPDLGYVAKWAFIQGLPVLVGIMISMVWVLFYLHKRVIMGRKDRLNSHLPALMGSFFTMFYFLYLSLTRASLDIFNCTPTDPPDGYTYLQVVFEKCYEPGGLHLTLLPWAAITFMVYTLGYPAVAGFILVRNREKVMEDQLLRASGMGEDRLTNPHAYTFRKMFYRLYYYFKPDKWFWILVILSRKFFISVVALMFTTNPAYQLAMALLVVFVGYALQVKHNPYMAPADHGEILKAHEQAALDGGVHARLKALLAEISGRRPKQAKRATWEGASLQAKTKLAARRTAAFFLSYNTLESTLLFCAVLVCLSGIMFESGRFESSYYSAQRDTLTWLTLLVIFASICYFLAVLIVEASIVVCGPDACKSKAQREKEAAEAKQKARLEGMHIGAVTNQAVNPLFNRGNIGAGADEEDFMSFLESAAGVDRPTDGLWLNVRGKIKLLLEQNETLAKELTALKRNARSGSVINSLRGVPKRALSKRTFGQMTVGGMGHEVQGLATNANPLAVTRSRAGPRGRVATSSHLSSTAGAATPEQAAVPGTPADAVDGSMPTPESEPTLVTQGEWQRVVPSPGAQPYWYNTVTQQSQWTQPEAWSEA